MSAKSKVKVAKPKKPEIKSISDETYEDLVTKLSKIVVLAEKATFINDSWPTN